MEEFELEQGEQITKQVRAHWMILVSRLSSPVILALVPFLVWPALSFLQTISPTEATQAYSFLHTNANWILLLLALWWLFLWLDAFSTYTRYCLTVWVITNTRIVDIRQYGFFSRKVSSFLLSRVQDVTTDVEGFIPTIFGFGTLNVETAGREEVFQMQGIKEPTELRDLIMREVAVLVATPAVKADAIATGV
jgi:uncharacterized membrane protein YdbT with pleckstrin-like domain